MHNGFDCPGLHGDKRQHASMAMEMSWAEEFQRVWEQPSVAYGDEQENTVWLPEIPSITGRYALVTIHNYDHLQAAFGQAFAEALHWRFVWQLHEWGATVIQVDRQRMLACIPGKAGHARRGGKSPISTQTFAWWQAALTSKPFTYKGEQAVAVIGVDPVDMHARRVDMGSGETLSGQKLRIITPSPELAAPQSGWRWRTHYKADMKAAVAFFRALARQDMCMAFQPIVSMAYLDTANKVAASIPSDAMLYQEALVRCAEPMGTSLLSPAVFVPALERLGLVHWLDHMVLDAVVHRLQDDAQLHLGCNVSALSLAPFGRRSDDMLARLRQRPDVAARLTFEITETSPMSDDEAALAFVRELQALGCRIAIDDFGVGFTRLDFVRAIKPQVIKLDAQMIGLAIESEAGFREFHCMAKLAAAMAPVVVAEGISGRAQRNASQRAGMEWMQGIGIGAPALAYPRLALSLPSTQQAVA